MVIFNSKLLVYQRVHLQPIKEESNEKLMILVFAIDYFPCFPGKGIIRICGTADGENLIMFTSKELGDTLLSAQKHISSKHLRRQPPGRTIPYFSTIDH